MEHLRVRPAGARTAKALVSPGRRCFISMFVMMFTCAVRWGARTGPGSDAVLAFATTGSPVRIVKRSGSKLVLSPGRSAEFRRATGRRATTR